MAAGRAVQTQQEQTLNSRQARDSVDQQMKMRTEEQRRIEEDRAIAAAERARVEAERKKLAAKRAQLLRAMEAAAVPTDSGVVAAPGAQRAGLSFGPNTPAMEPVTMGVQPISFGPSTPAPTYVPPGGARATVAARQQDTPLTTRLAPVWAQLEQQGGLPQGYFRRLAEIESSLNPEARNPNSTASGLFQLLRDTAQEYNVQNPNDPMDATQGVARYTAVSLPALQQALGRQPTGGELYLAHQQGATGAVNLLRNPDQLASAVVGADEVRLNGGDPETMTAGAFADLWIGEFEGTSNSRSSNAAMAAAGITFSPAPTAGLTEPAAPSITEVDPEATVFQQDIQGLLRQGDIAGAINRIETGLAIGTYGPMGSPVGGMVGYFKDTPDEAARRTQVQQALQWFQDSKNASYMRDNPALIAQAAADPLAFVAAQPRGAPDAAAAETPTAPIQVRTPGGTTIAVSEPDAPAAGLTVPPAAAPNAAPAAGLTVPPAAAGVPTTRGTVAGEILGLPRGAPAPQINPKVIDAGPARMTQEMEMLAAQETQLALLQQYYVDMEAIPEAVNVQLQRLQLRSAHQALQGAQAVARMEMGDYSMAADALSTAMGTLVQIQPRVDGTFNLLANGQVYADGLTAAELKAYVQQTTNSAYRQQQAELNKLVLEADIEREQAGFKVQTLDSGKVLMYKEDGTEAYIIDPEANISGPGIKKSVNGPTALPILLR
jgi:hypothetical protein